MAEESIIRERVQELTWVLLDEQVTEDEFRLLENLLLSDDNARDAYIGCVQLHADLLTHFAATPTAETSKSQKRQGIDILNIDLLPLNPSSEDVTHQR